MIDRAIHPMIRAMVWTLGFSRAASLARAALPTLAVALTTLAAGQAPAEGADQPESRFVPRTPLERLLAGRYGDHHIAVVGDDLITRDEVLGFIQSSGFEDPAAELPAGMAPAEVDQIRLDAGLRQMIERQLKIQGGKNQGYEPEMLAGIKERFFRQRIEAMGGESRANETLRASGMDPDEFRNLLERQLLRQFWQDSVTGRTPGPTGRKYVDPYVRPGTLFFQYRNYLRSGDVRLGQIVGKSPERLVLRRLVIAAQSDDPAVAAEGERLASALRDNIEQGIVELEDAVNQYAPTNFRGPESRLEFPTRFLVDRLSAIHPSFDADAFLETSDVGAISPVLRVDQPGAAPVFVVYQVEERVAATEAGGFLDLELQQRLRETIETDRSDVRIARGLGELVRRTYVAPVEIRNALLQGGRRSQPPAGEGR